MTIVDALGSIARVATGATKAAEAATVGTRVVAGAAEAAATGAKIVEATGAATEVAKVAASVSAPTALAEGLEAGLRTDPHATVGHLAELNPDLAKSSSVVSEAGKTSADAVLNGVEKAKSDTQVEIDGSVNDRLASWDKNNPRPDPQTQSQEFNGWVQNRYSAQEKYGADAAADAALSKWDADNPMPDGSDPNAFNEWVENRAKQERELKEETASENVSDNNSESESGKKEDEVEVAKKIQRLKKLYSIRADLIESIAILQGRELKSKQDQLQLTDYKMKKDGYDQEIKMIETELAGAVTKASLPKKLLIIAALAMAPVAITALQGSKQQA